MKLYVGNLRERKKKKKNSIHFQNEKLHNLETLRDIHEKNDILLETSLLKNCGKVGGVYINNVATEKHRFAASKRRIIKPY